MNAREAILLLSGVITAVSGCGERGGQQDPEVQGRGIVRVEDVILTEEDLGNLLPGDERIPFTAEEKRLFVKRWVDTEILYQEALRRGLKSDPRVQARVRCLEQEFLADHLVFNELQDRTRVTDAEIEEYFNEHEKEYVYEYRVSHILVNTIEEAEEVEELLKNNSFSWVANKRSVDPVAKRGGDLGYLTKGNMVPEFEKVIFDMNPGDVSGIVKSDFGYHIIKLVGMREARVKIELEDVREQIMNELMIEKRGNVYRELMERLRMGTNIEYIQSAYAPDSSIERGDTADVIEWGIDTTALDDAD